MIASIGKGGQSNYFQEMLDQALKSHGKETKAQGSERKNDSLPNCG